MSLTITAFAAEERIVSDTEISDVIAEINEEYGTNIHILTDEELALLGLPVSEPLLMTAAELTQLEDTLRYIAATQIPQFKATTQEANAVVASIGDNLSRAAAFDESRSTNEPITATKEI